MTEDELRDEKKLAFYSAAVNTWTTTSLELDKSLLMLSTGGIGLLMSLLSSIKSNSFWFFISYLLAILGFAVNIVLVLMIFKKNQRLLEVLVNKDDKPPKKEDEEDEEVKKEELKLKCYDISAYGAFAFGIFFLAVITVVSAYPSSSKKEEKMSKNPISTQATQAVYDSASGLSKMQPSRAVSTAKPSVPESTTTPAPPTSAETTTSSSAPAGKEGG